MNTYSQDQIEQYVQGRMSESDSRAFEDYCVANPEFARQVEFEQRLKGGIAHVARSSTREFVRSSDPHRWKMAAAIVGIALSIGTLFYVWHRYLPIPAPAVLSSVNSDSHGEATPVRLAMVRGEESRPALQSGLMRLEIAGLYDTSSHYSIALDRMDENKHIHTIATLHGVKPASPVTLEVLLDGDQLSRGTYSLRVRKQTSVDEPLDIEFEKN